MKATAWLAISESSMVYLVLLVTSHILLVVEAGQVSVDYAPGDTRLLDYTAFCRAVKVAYNNAPVNIGPSALYSLNTDHGPMLTDVDTFSFSWNGSLNSYYTWNLHFYPNSLIEVSGFIEGNGSAIYYLIQGKESFNDWKSNVQSQPNSVVHSLNINSSCSNGTYMVKEEDQYFLVIQKIDPESVNLTIDIMFSRTRYAVKLEDVSDQCHFNASDSCSLQTPIDRSSSVLLVYGTSTKSPETWNTLQFGTDVTCEPRIWLYAVVTVGPVAVILLCIVCIVCCGCGVYCSKKKSPEDHPLLRDWDVDSESNRYYPYSERASRLDPLTELAIATPDVSNPHIAPFKEDLKPPSFKDNQLTDESLRFSTFKP